MNLGLFPRVRRGVAGPLVSRALRDRAWYDAAAALAEDRPVVLIHPGGALMVRSVERITTPQMAELIRLTSGFVQVGLTEDRCDALLLNEAIPTQRHQHRMAHGQSVSVDAAVGVGTGISAADRARTVRVLGDLSSHPTDLRRPGHVIPVRIKPNDSWSPAAAALRLAQQSGFAAAVFAELVPSTDPTKVVTTDEALAIATGLGTVAVVAAG